MSEYFEYHINDKFQTTPNTNSPASVVTLSAASKKFTDYLDYKNYDKQKFDKNDVNDRRRALLSFKEKIGSSLNLVLKDKSCYNDDDFLMQFLFAKKFHCDDAFKLLINYYLYKEKNKQLLNKLTIFDESIQLAIKDGFPGVIKERDRRGRKCIVFFTSNWDPQQISLECIYRAFLLSLEKLLEDKQNQSQGFVVIVDWTNFTLKQSKYLNPKILRTMIDGLQDCLPIKFKAIHFVGQPWYVEAVLSVIKPFLNEKIRQRIYLHGGNLSTLHQAVPKDILPPEFGGEGPSLNALDWYHILLESSQNMETFKPYRITGTTIYSKVPICKNDESTSLLESSTPPSSPLPTSSSKSTYTSAASLS